MFVAWMLAYAAPALAQLPRSTFAGRQIGDGRVAEAALRFAIAADGALLIADRLHDRVRRVDPATGVMTTLAGSVPGTGGNGMIADQAQLKDPLRAQHLDMATGDLLISPVRELHRRPAGRVDACPGEDRGHAWCPGARPAIPGSPPPRS
jgi:hypothetical protein